MSVEKEFLRRVIADISEGRVDREGLQNAKLKLCRELGMVRVPANSEILEALDAVQRKELAPLLMNKPVRTLSPPGNGIVPAGA